MKHLLIKDRNLRRVLINEDKTVFLNTFLGCRGLLKNKQTRLINRCLLTNRSRSVLTFFKHSRIVVRRNSLNGFYPGVIKASW